MQIIEEYHRIEIMASPKWPITMPWHHSGFVIGMIRMADHNHLMWTEIKLPSHFSTQNVCVQGKICVRLSVPVAWASMEKSEYFCLWPLLALNWVPPVHLVPFKSDVFCRSQAANMDVNMDMFVICPLNTAICAVGKFFWHPVSLNWWFFSMFMKSKLMLFSGTFLLFNKIAKWI